MNCLINPYDTEAFRRPLDSEQRAQQWYQQSKARWIDASPMATQEQQCLALLALIAEQPITASLPTAAADEAANIKGLLQLFEKIDSHLTRNDELKLTGLGYELAKSLLTLLPKAVQQVRETMSAHTPLTRLQQLQALASATLGIKPTAAILDKVQQAQLQQLNDAIRKIHRHLLKQTLTNEIDTIVHSEVVLQPDALDSRLCLAHRPQQLNVSTGVTQQSVPQGNFLEYAAAPHKSVLFNLGDGDHQVQGVAHKRNLFLLSEGRQWISGGEQGNQFIFSLTAEALQRQLARTRQAGRPLCCLAGKGGENKLLLQSELPKPAGNDLRLDGQHLSYEIDLKRGEVWVRPRSAADHAATPSALLLMRLRNIEQAEIRTIEPTYSVIRGSAGANTLVLNCGDTVYTEGEQNTVYIQGAGSVYSACGNNRYRVTPQINQQGDPQIKIMEACPGEGGISRIELPIEHHQLSDWRLIEHDLVVQLGQQPQHCQLTLGDVYQTVNGQRHLRHDRWHLLTQDGLLLLPQWPTVIAAGEMPAIKFIAHYAKTWDQRPGAAAITNTSAPYQYQPTPAEYLTAPASIGSRLIADLSSLAEPPSLQHSPAISSQDTSSLLGQLASPAARSTPAHAL